MGKIKNILHRFGLLLEQVFGIRAVLTPKGELRHALSIYDDLIKQGHTMSTVFDVGAHRGETARAVRDEFPRATVHCFEPVPENVSHLEETIAHVRGVHAHQLALSRESGTEEMYLSEHSTAHSLTYSDDRTRSVEVECSTVDAFCRAKDIDAIDFLKIDTEGHDLDVLFGAKSMLEHGRIAYVMTEVALDPRETYFSLFDDVREFLAERDFRVFGIYDQHLDWERQRHLHFANAVFVHKTAPWNDGRAGS